MDVSITRNFRISLKTSRYHPEFPGVIGQVTGRIWNHEQRVWTVPMSSVGELCQTMTDKKVWTKKDAKLVKGLISDLMDYRNVDIDMVTSVAKHAPRSYQEDSLRFFINRGSALGALDMALGKSFLGLAYTYYLLQTKKIEKALIVVPVSAIWHWYRENKKFFGNKMKFCVLGYDIDSAGHAKKLGREDRLEQWKSKEYNGFILNYEKVRDIVSIDKDGVVTLSPLWDNKHNYIVIADEVTRVKSWSAQRTKHLKALPAKYRIGLSGRPIENNIGELFTILDWIWPQCLGSWTKFEKKFVRKNRFGKIVSVKDKATIKNIVDYITIKYNRYDVLSDLPSIIRNQYDVKFSPDEEHDYNKISHRIDDALAVIKSTGRATTAYMNALAMLQLSRIFCDHPVLVRNSPSRTAKLLDITTAYSSKLEEFKLIIDEILKLDEKVVVFSEFKKMIDILDVVITEKYPLIKTYVYTGGISSLKKQKILDGFVRDPNPAVFLATDSGAYAIELQCASYIINYDLPWNPAIIEQRISRLHRPGQKKSVVVIDMVVRGADKVEERVLSVIKRKEELYKDIMGSVDNAYKFF